MNERTHSKARGALRGVICILGIALVLILTPLGRAADLDAFITNRCLDCHDDTSKKGKLSLEALGPDITAANAKTWLKALEQIERRTMPPADKEQPTPAERHAAEVALETKLVAFAQAQPAPRSTVLRRLNRVEYRNTIRDLLSLNLGSFDPTREFPDDNRIHGFPTNGEKLVTSSFLLRQYLEAAEQIVGRAVYFEPKPEVRHWDLSAPFDRTTKGFYYSEAAYYRTVVKLPQPYQTLWDRMDGAPKGGYHPVDELRAGVPVSGWYTIRIQAEAKFRDAEFDLKKFHFPPGNDPSEPIRLSLFTGTLEGIDPENKEVVDYAATHQQNGERLLATWDLTDDRPVTLECRVWLDRGHFPRLGFPNGPTEANNRLTTYFRENKYTLLNKEQLARFEEDAVRGDNYNTPMWFESPRIRVSKIEIEGPLNEEWPPASHRALFGEQPYTSAAAAGVLQRFATRAWRRPAEAAEVAPIVQLVRAAERHGKTPEAAILQGLEAILCSPEFLYREEKGETLSAAEIATRLSYFLWSSMPDEALQKRDLTQPGAMRVEAERLLADPRADSFADEFLNGWLALRKLGTMAPDVNKFAVYYADDLEPAMRKETGLFFRQLLRTNGTIDRFLDSDYAFVNRRLAKLYGIDLKTVEANVGQPVEGLQPEDLVPQGEGNAPSLGFARVPLTDPRRGGLLGQASVLTLTANGVDTSPVIRGVWLLENILGAPPAPPPPDVPTIEPDIRGAKTIRDQLEKHRESATCRSCHRQIDPPGFALENFDAIGRWRGHYQRGSAVAPVDASGQFGVEKFTDITGFKKALLARRDEFARCLVEKLLIHALGRELDVLDRPAIRQIVEASAADGYHLRTLVLLCAESEVFRRK
ncbi:MAG TPA: DUF1592 domain-containing protein [Chthoniobacteraceae bacterium]|nr:DUF1592 domain-containing protein [Chthoniobacteraceae bacterium]